MDLANGKPETGNRERYFRSRRVNDKNVSGSFNTYIMEDLSEYLSRTFIHNVTQ